MKNEANLRRKKVTIESTKETAVAPPPPKIELADVHAKLLQVDQHVIYQTKVLHYILFILALILFVLIVKLFK